MTATKESLVTHRVIKENFSNVIKLLHPSNLDREELVRQCRDVADYCNLPSHCEMETTHGSSGERADFAIFDFSKNSILLNKNLILIIIVVLIALCNLIEPMCLLGVRVALMHLH